MAINPNIALSFQAPKFDDPLNKLAQMEQIKAYRQNALAKQMEMDAAVREREMTNALRQRLASGKDLGLSEAAMFGAPGMEVYGAMAGAKASDATRQAKELEIASNLYKNVYLSKVPSVRTAEDAKNWAASIQNDPRLSPITSQVSPEQAMAGLPKTDADVAAWQEQLLVPFEDRFSAENAAELARESQAAAMERAQLGVAASAIQGGLNRAATASNRQQSDRLTIAQKIMQNAYNIDSVTGNYVRNPEVSDEMLRDAVNVVKGAIPQVPDSTLEQPVDAAASGVPAGRTPPPPGAPSMTAAPGTLLPGQVSGSRAQAAEDKEITKLEAKMKIEQPEIEKGILLSDPVTLNAINEIDNIFNHPDLKDVTGNLEGWAKTFKGLIDQGDSDVNAIVKSLKSKAWLGSIQSFGKGSGLTPITDAEGDKLEAAYALLDQTMGTPAFQKNLLAFRDQLEASRRVIYNAYNDKYGKLNIKGWRPLSAVYQGAVPQKAIDALLENPSERRIRLFDRAFGEDVREYLLKGAK
jgi:hypothetical protein